MKKFFIFCLSVIFLQTSIAQLKSPTQFLGYELGSRFTRHDNIVRYFEYAATAMPQKMKLLKYGETNAHRPLYVATISSANNLQNIDIIRQNNVALAQGNNGNSTATAKIPIVWLSYNVHGNEPSSSEAAMLTLYSLLDESNANTQKWLQNTVVLIDPCLNPDGRERYVNWYSDVVGKNPDASWNAREHNEPWPGGRINHYYFDLNRDWAWQTQVETQQRMKVYQQWMPEVHVDFHEQGPSNPYYFAPAAEPYHPAITQWQKDFQVTVGKNHARYFDKNGWLYFTKEIFDLFYPSYGDTYPIFNGAIGMTYEQGGGPAGGLAVVTNEGDTLTLLQRLTHHYTTGLSTVETASNNADQLVTQFAKYFTDAVKGNGALYKSYVIKNSDADALRINALKTLLEKNKIQYYNGSGSGKGYNYFTGKEESFFVGNNDLVIPGLQPQGVLLKTLMEPKTILNDSITYDITAWALPYMYGLQAFASKENIATKTYQQPAQIYESANAYGYIIPWSGLASAQVLSELLQMDIRVRYAEKPFSQGGKDFSAGSLIIIKNGNDKFRNIGQIIERICRKYNVPLQSVAGGLMDKGLDFGSSSIHYIKAPRVALLTGEDVSPNAAGEVWNLFDNELKYPITLIDAGDFARADWDKIDVLIMPSGKYKFLSDKASSSALQQWVQKGGRIVALENAVAQLSKQEWSIIKAKEEAKTEGKEKNDDPYALLEPYESRERDALSGITPGAIFRVQADNTHPLMFGYPNFYYTLKMDDAVYNYMEGGWNVGILKKENQVAGFVGYKLNKKLKDGLVFGVQDLGRGSITYLTDDVLFRDFWENGKLMFCNSVFFVGQ